MYSIIIKMSVTVRDTGVERDTGVNDEFVTKMNALAQKCLQYGDVLNMQNMIILNMHKKKSVIAAISSIISSSIHMCSFDKIY